MGSAILNPDLSTSNIEVPVISLAMSATTWYGVWWSNLRHSQTKDDKQATNSRSMVLEYRWGYKCFGPSSVSFQPSHNFGNINSYIRGWNHNFHLVLQLIHAWMSGSLECQYVRDNWLKKVASSTMIFKVFLFNTTRLYCLQNLKMIARMFWKILDVYNKKSYCKFLSLKVPRWESYWFCLKALNRSDSYNLVMVNCLHGHGMIQSLICFLWLMEPSLYLWWLMMGIRRASSYYFMQRRLSTSCFCLII